MMGVDIGTTSTKAVLFTEKGDVVEKANVGYPLHTPDISTAEQDPDEIFQAVLEAVTQIKKAHEDKAISFISFSSAMHSLIAVDEHGLPITPCITWADNRSEKWSEKIKTEWNGHGIYRRTGTPIHPMSPLSKITWLVQEHPEIDSRTYKYIGIKEYIFHKLFGTYVVDHSIASATGLMNLEELDWDEEALEVAGISREKLSELVSTTTIFTGLKEEYARASRS